MIKRIRVKNYRSLREITLEPGLRNVFVGPNASGKSNFLDALKFLADLANFGLSRAFGDHRMGFNEVFWKGTSPDNVITFDATFEVPVEPEPAPIQFDYLLEVEGSPKGLLTVKTERLRIRKDESVVNLLEMTSGHGEVRHADGSKAFDPPRNPSLSMLEFNVPNWMGGLFKLYLSSWRFYKLTPLLMKQMNVPRRAAFLTETGDNFADFLTTLTTEYKDAFEKIEQVVRDTFPGVEKLIPQLTQYGQVFLTSKEKFLGKPVSIWNMAEGELAFIAFLALIFSPPELGAPVYCVEELENHLHPRLLETLVEVFKQTQSTLEEKGLGAGQIFATTHSPYLVDQFDLEELIVVEKEKGETHLSRPKDKAHLRELVSRKELGLGELWYSGALGGV